ncbi:MAG: membrane integrity-associated transporter subunit PqiC [Alphaproteobacteria bacterium]|nr:membrane integrity-associated transporter subunit PqiC [Alphaproteobacteria bacterium]
MHISFAIENNTRFAFEDFSKQKEIFSLFYKILSLKNCLKFWSIALYVFLSGCVQLLPDPGDPPQLIELQPQLEAKINISPVSWQLGVEEPLADLVLNSVKIPIRINTYSVPNYLKYVQGKEWRTRLPLMIQNLIIKSFETSGKIKGVARVTQGLKSNYTLITELNNFEFNLLENEEKALVHIQLTAKIMAQPEHKILATQIFEEKIESTTQEFAALFSALEKATGTIISNVTAWALTQQKHP